MERYAREFHRRRSIRLAGYDYASAGAYFVTICTHHREPLFGEILAEEMHLNRAGSVVAAEWLATEEIRARVAMDAFLVMPNHFHGIIVLESPDLERDGVEVPITVGAHCNVPLPKAPQQLRRNREELGSVVAAFKAAVTRKVNLLRNTPGAPVWQRNYYETVIRSEKQLDAVREYISATIR